MAIANPQFRVEGSQPGQAQFWRFTSHVSKEQIAAFGPMPEQAWEHFERWFSYLFELPLDNLIAVFFDLLQKESVEDFEENWANSQYISELPTGHVNFCIFDENDNDGFEVNWMDGSFHWFFNDVTSTPALIGGDLVETFSRHWAQNHFFRWHVDLSDVTSAKFHTNEQGVEDFDLNWSATDTG